MNNMQQFAEEFRDCTKILSALGDENRQHMILTMIQLGKCGGVRVGTITETTNLSRPAVSRHLRILREAGLVRVRREGTKNYYYFDADDDTLESLIRLFSDAKEILNHLPDRRWKEY